MFRFQLVYDEKFNFMPNNALKVEEQFKSFIIPSKYC